ncbi:MAG: OmpA family protein [Desulfamplus sp.]|nr:OmpA family protein [Desulfamplus sp.]
MRKHILVITFIFLLMNIWSFAVAVSDPQDASGSKDPALFSRMSGFHIYQYTVKDFDRFEFPTGTDKKENVEGNYTKAIYYANEGITNPSGIQIALNYINAAKAVGGVLVYEFEDGGTQYVIVKVEKDDKEFWAQIEAADNGMYTIHVVEKQLMKQVVVANAEAMSGSIKDIGRVSVYGIYFDTGKADLKPESEQAMTEIVKMLKADPNLKIYVVGHTDNTGQFAANVKLSMDRAVSVVNSLTIKYGIAAARLTPFGCGPVAPVASNKTDDGKAKNRRVELVSQ